jgi:hypothetical protein
MKYYMGRNLSECYLMTHVSVMLTDARHVSWRTADRTAGDRFLNMSLEFVFFYYHIQYSHGMQTASYQAYVCIQKFPGESITKYTLTFGITRSEATQRVMAAILTRLTHKIAIQLHLVAESCTICSSRSRRPVRKLLDTPSYTKQFPWKKQLDRVTSMMKFSRAISRVKWLSGEKTNVSKTISVLVLRVPV